MLNAYASYFWLWKPKNLFLRTSSYQIIQTKTFGNAYGGLHKHGENLSRSADSQPSTQGE